MDIMYLLQQINVSNVQMQVLYVMMLLPLNHV